MISVKASGGSKETKLDYTFRRLGLDRKYIDLASADQGQVFYLGFFFFFLVSLPCFEGCFLS